MRIESSFKDQKVVITGHTGFKGSWLALWLTALGAKVFGISNGVPTTPSHWSAISLGRKVAELSVDISNVNEIERAISTIEPDFIFHLAAQAIVPDSYERPAETFLTNSIGTVGVLEAIRKLEGAVVAVLITSDKVYDNLEWIWGYRETDTLGGKDPYSASKAMAEHAIFSYFHSYFASEQKGVRIGVGRAGNVIGGGDWARYRVVPDIVRAWASGIPAKLRSPNATRPWQHVLEPLSGYLWLAHCLKQGVIQSGEAFNFGPNPTMEHTVVDLVEAMARHWDNARWEVDRSSRISEATLLRLNIDKATSLLDWRPTLNWEETVRFTASWYRRYYDSEGKDAKKASLSQIADYMAAASERGIAWAQ